MPDLNLQPQENALQPGSLARRVYVVLSPRSLPYSRHALQSLLANSIESLDISLITDTESDRAELIQAMEALRPPGHHCWRVFEQQELADREASVFGPRANLRSFRRGHPCWRKVTDPLLLGRAGEELVLLDPDLYFPNPFQFEETPREGLLLMWQEPNCLLPADLVRRLMDRGIPLARHVDVGVAHWRASPDLDWLDWLLGQLGGPAIPRVMHVEAIVWAAIAMRAGGGYLDPHYWRCWRRTPLKRVLRKCGMSGSRILRSEPWAAIKCFHAGGEAKWWLDDTYRAGIPRDGEARIQPGMTRPFIPLGKRQFACEQALKRVFRNLGYYRIFGAG